MFNCYEVNMCYEANMGCDNNDSKSNLVILVYLYLLFFSVIGVLYHFYSQTERKYNKLYYKVLNDVSLFLDNNILDEQESSGSESGSGEESGEESGSGSGEESGSGSGEESGSGSGEESGSGSESESEEIVEEIGEIVEEIVEEKCVNEGYAALAFKSMSDSFAKKSHEYFFDNY